MCHSCGLYVYRILPLKPLNFYTLATSLDMSKLE